MPPAGKALSSRQPAPALLHRELSLVQRLLRDILSDDIAHIRLDSEKEFQRTLDMVNVLQPELAPRVRLYNGPQAILDRWRDSWAIPCDPWAVPASQGAVVAVPAHFPTSARILPTS